MTSEVTELIAALKDGSMSLDEVTRRFRERTWPRRRKPAPATYLEMAAAAQQDPDPDVAGSFDDVDAAYERGDLSDDEYDALAKAMAESLSAEDQREGDGQS
jgi:hypothetical protein